MGINTARIESTPSNQELLETLRSGIEQVITKHGGKGYGKDKGLQDILSRYVFDYTENIRKTPFWRRSQLKKDSILVPGTDLRFNPQQVTSIIATYIETHKDTLTDSRRLQHDVTEENERIEAEREAARLKKVAKRQAEQKAKQEAEIKRQQEEQKKKEDAKAKQQPPQPPSKQEQKEQSEVKENKEESPYKKLIEMATEPIILGNVTKNQVALTFDDGNSHVEEILDLLKEYNIQCTFFITGGNIEKKAELWKRALKEGHQICNHTISHYASSDDLAKDPVALEKEIIERENIYIKYLGKENLARMKREHPFFRFPGGGGGGWDKKQNLLNVLKKHGYLPVNWTYTDPIVPTGEENHDPTLPVNDGNKLANGGIVLLHFNEGGLENAKRCIEGTAGTQGEKGPNPSNPGLTGKAGQQKAATLSELLNPSTYMTPIGRGNKPEGVTISYITKTKKAD